ncbi:NADPH-dependent FMN reductase [Bacillus timonensis]|uniref:NADPH-dependent FMN reductase n=1 Tax=Bacillus timonensis TaxID=1033734 RepID=UPI000288E381|nr:NAD(P)H-dependent oxidoreductase [Bacillus timonensis]
MKLLGISGTIIGSKTRLAVEKALEFAKEYDPNIDIELLDLKEYDLQFCDGRAIEDYSEDTKKVIEMISNADVFLVGTPIFHGSIPGVLKNLFDLIPAEVFQHKVFGFIATAGNHHHYLMIENQLRPIAGYFNAYVSPYSAFIHSEDFKDNKIANNEILNQLSHLANDVIKLHKLNKEEINI